MDKHIPSYDLYKTLDTSLGFELYKLEEAYNPYDGTTPHRHNYFEILFFREGGGFHEIDFNSYPVHENALHFISPEQVHQLRRDRHVTGYVISFAKDFCYEESADPGFVERFPFFNNPYAAPVVHMQTEEQKKSLLHLLSSIEKECLSQDDDKRNILFSYLSILLIYAKRLYAPAAESGKALPVRSELTHKFKLLVEKNFREIKSVAEYAALLNISAGHLNDTVQRDTGKTASEMIHERIILEAKRLLYHSAKSIKEIAFILHYDDPSYFVKFFKTHMNNTPENFRKEIREKYH